MVTGLKSENILRNQYINSPRGDDISQWDGTTFGTSAAAINSITVGTNRAAYVRGVNWTDKTGLTAMELVIDGTTAKTWKKHIVPHLSTDFADIDTFKPPLKATSTVVLQATGSTTVGEVDSVIVAYEDEA